MDPVEVMLEDLARQVAQKSVEVAQWKARALLAEAALNEIKEEETDEEGPTLSVVEDPEADGVN